MPTERESQILTEAKKHQVQTQEETMIMRKLCTGIFQICCYYQVYFTIFVGKYLEKKGLFISAYSTYRKIILVKQIISLIHPPKCLPPLRGRLG